jgi:hypothetical protein
MDGGPGGGDEDDDQHGKNSTDLGPFAPFIGFISKPCAMPALPGIHGKSTI